MILRITNGFDRLSDANLEVKANTIVTAMTGNTYFPTPNPDLPTPVSYTHIPAQETNAHRGLGGVYG